MKTIKTANEFEKAFKDEFDGFFETVGLKSFFACFLASKALPNVYNDSFLASYASGLKDLRCVYDLKNERLIGDRLEWEIKMIDVPMILKIDEAEKDNPNLATSGGYSIVFSAL